MQRVKNYDIRAKTKTKVVVSSTKSECSNRVIPIPDFLLEIISIKAQSYSKDAFILTGSETKYIEPRSYQNIFKAILKECNISNINFHALRHTFATRCIELDFDIKSLSEILGHSDIKITLKYYVHSSLEQKERQMQKLKALIC